MELQLDATITVLLISKISSTCFGQTFAHLQERKTDFYNIWYNVLVVPYGCYGFEQFSFGGPWIGFACLAQVNLICV
jgi:hypothetical protein